MELFNKEKPVIVQEFVPGKQITLCHIIANPGEVLYTKLGLDPQVDYSRSALISSLPYFGQVSSIKRLISWYLARFSAGIALAVVTSW